MVVSYDIFTTGMHLCKKYEAKPTQYLLIYSPPYLSRHKDRTSKQNTSRSRLLNEARRPPHSSRLHFFVHHADATKCGSLAWHPWAQSVQDPAHVKDWTCEISHVRVEINTDPVKYWTLWKIEPVKCRTRERPNMYAQDRQTCENVKGETKKMNGKKVNSRTEGNTNQEKRRADKTDKRATKQIQHKQATYCTSPQKNWKS